MINLDLYIRQMGLINPVALDFPIGIVGAGSIGSWTCLALLKLGCQDITIFDFDKVEKHNSSSQVYTSFDEGKFKVDALQERLIGLTESLPQIENKRIEKSEVNSLSGFQVLIVCTDTIDSRNLVFEGLEGGKIVLIDARMAGNIIQVFTTHLDNKEEVTFYKKTFFPVEEEELVACSMRSVVYNCFIVAGLICDIVAKIGNNKSIPHELEVDLENFTLFK